MIVAGCPICEDLHHGASSCPHSLVGAKLGKYDVTKFLAAGGMGAVYVGKHESLGSLVAVKTLHRALLPKNATTDDKRQLAETLVKRFTDEARRAASLRHPNIVRVEDLGMAPDGTPYLAMEFLEGMSLKELVESNGPLAPDRAAHLVAQALDALEFAHQRNIIHRDIKPENLYLQHPGQSTESVKVLDFGIAKAVGDGATQLGLTQTGHGAMGTFYYMSPEQAKDPRRVTASSDVFSVGASLFELLTGRTVLHEIERELTTSGLMAMQFLHGVLTAIMEGNIERHPRAARGDVPEWLDAAVARSLAHEPTERFISAGEMAATLRGAGAGARQDAGAPRSNPLALAATAPSAEMAAVEPSQPELPMTHVAPSIRDAERVSAKMMAARQSDPVSGPALGSTTAQSAGEQVAAVSQPYAPKRSGRFVLAGAAVIAIAGTGIAVALVGGGGGGKAANSTGQDAGQVAAIDARAVERLADAATRRVNPVLQLAATGDCAGAREALTTDAIAGDGLADALVAIGNCELAAGRDGPARESFKRALEAVAGHPSATRALAKLDKTRDLDRKPAEKLAEKPAEKGPGFLSVNSRPPTSVYIDGRQVGRTPLVKLKLKPGRHRVTLVNSDFQIKRVYTAVIKPGEVHLLVKKFPGVEKSATGGERSSKCDKMSCLLPDPPACCAKLSKSKAIQPSNPNLPDRPSKSDVQRGMARVSSAAKSCGERNGFSGRIRVHIRISGSGRVMSARASGGPSAVNACVSSAVKRARFPKTRRGLSFTFGYSL